MALIALTIGVIGAGCGGGDNGPAIRTSSLDEAAYDRRAEAICADGRSRGLRFSGLPTNGEIEREAMTRAIKRSLLPAFQRVIDQLYALGAPAGEEQQTGAFLSAFQHSVDAAKRIREPTLREVEAKLEPAGALAERDGLEACIYS